MLVRELLFELGFDDAKATRNAKRFDKVIGGLKRNLVRLGAVATTAAIGLGAAALKAGNDYQAMSNKLKLVTDSTNELKAAQEGVFAISQKARTSLEASTDLYFGFSKAAEQYGISQERILRITETTAKLATLASNKDPAGTNAALFQLRQGIMSGQLRGQELNSVLEQATPVADAIARGMGIPFSEIRKMAEKGKITGIAVLEALESQAANTDSEFANLDRTAEQARTQLKNAFGFYAGRLAEDGDAIQAQIEFYDALREIISSGGFRNSLVFALKTMTAIIKVVTKLVEGLNKAINAMGGLERIVRVLGSALLALATVSIARAIIGLIALVAQLGVGFTAAWLLNGAMTVLSGLMALVTWPVLAAVAAFTALFFIFEDLWAWYNGEGSLIVPGLIKMWSWFAEFFTGLWDGLLNTIEEWVDKFLAFIQPAIDAWNAFRDSKFNPGNWFDGEEAKEVAATKLMPPSELRQSNVFKPEVTINVPPGTMREQVDYMDSRFRTIMEDQNRKQLREARNNFPEVE